METHSVSSNSYIEYMKNQRNLLVSLSEYNVEVRLPYMLNNWYNPTNFIIQSEFLIALLGLKEAKNQASESEPTEYLLHCDF